MYKRLTLVTNVMNSKNEKDYLSQAMVDIQDRDKVINKELIRHNLQKCQLYFTIV